MWLPTWLGMNADLKKKVEAHIQQLFVGKEATLEEMHTAVVDFFCAQFPELTGLRGYLEAITLVRGPEAMDGHQG